MAGKDGISGVGIAVLAGGSILLWAGIKGTKWTTILRDLVAGNQPSATTDYPIGQDIPGGSSGTGTGNTFTGVGTPGGISKTDWTLVQTYGKLYGVDPLLLVAIGFQETHWGTLGAGRQGLILGVGAFDSGTSYKWKGLNAQLSQGAKILAQHGVHNINDVMAGKAAFWATEPSWESGVKMWYDKLKSG